jgi:hypothetical protein
MASEFKGLRNFEVLFPANIPRLSKAGWLRAAQTGAQRERDSAKHQERLVKSRSNLIDARVAHRSKERFANIYKEASQLYQPFLMFRAIALALTLRARPLRGHPALKSRGVTA